MTSRPVLLRPALRRTAPALALLAATGLSGCSYFSPTQTEVPYNAGDGVPVSLGDIEVRNLVIVSDKDGGPGTLTGAVINTGDAATKVDFAAGQGSKASVDVEPHQSSTLSQRGEAVLASYTGKPGDMVTIQVSTDKAGATQVSVPILPAVEYYKTYAPTASPTSATTSAPGAPSASTTAPSASTTPSASPSS